MSQQLAVLGAAPAQAVSAPAPVAASQPVTTPAPAQDVVATAASTIAAAPAASSEEQASGPVRYDVKKAFGAIARIHTQSDSGLTPRQQARLDAFIRRYNARTAGSKAAAEASRERLADPRVVTGFRPLVKELVYPILVNRSRGARLWDMDGNEYVDALNGFGSNFFGYAPDFVREAVHRQLDDGYEIGPQTPLAGEVAALFCELTGLERAAFCNTGSEAVMGAMRIARTVTGRSTIAIFTGTYHGIFDEVIVRGTKKLKAVPAAPGILPEGLQNVHRARLRHARVAGDPAGAGRRAGRRHGGAGAEPQARLPAARVPPRGAGDHPGVGLGADLRRGDHRLPQPPGRRAGGTSACGPTSPPTARWWAAACPSASSPGKRVHGRARRRVAGSFGDNSVPTVGVTYFAGTFVRHPLALAAAEAVLKHLKEQGPALQQEVTARTERLASTLNAHFASVGAPLKIKHFASLWKAIWTEDQPHGDLLFYMLRDRGVHIYDGFPCFLTTAHGDAEVDFIIKAFKESVAELQEAGFLPEPPRKEPPRTCSTRTVRRSPAHGWAAIPRATPPGTSPTPKRPAST